MLLWKSNCWWCLSSGSTQSCQSWTWRWWKLCHCMRSSWMKIQSTPCTPSCRANSTTCSSLPMQRNRYHHLVTAVTLCDPITSSCSVSELPSIYLSMRCRHRHSVGALCMFLTTGLPWPACIRFICNEWYCSAGIYCSHGAASSWSPHTWPASSQVSSHTPWCVGALKHKEQES